VKGRGEWRDSTAGLWKQAGFDGAYTYFAADGFTYGATAANWPRMAAFCRRHGLLFVPSVGPGCAFLRAPRAPRALAPWHRHV